MLCVKIVNWIGQHRTDMKQKMLKNVVKRCFVHFSSAQGGISLSILHSDSSYSKSFIHLAADILSLLMIAHRLLQKGF